MNKNKKLISLVCVIAMIFTMLSSFTFASAAGEGVTLSTPTYNDDGTVSVDIKYAGITGGVADGDIKIEMPSEVVSVTANPTATVAVLQNGVFTYKFALGGAAKPDTEGVLTTLTLTLNESLTSPSDITIKEGSYIDSNEVNPTYYEIGSNLETNVVSIPADPNAPTPKPTTDVTPAPVATEEPESPEDPNKPVIKDPVTADKGLNFGEPIINENDLTVSVDIKYVGITGGIADGDIKIEMPSEVTEVIANPTATVAVLQNGVFTYKFALGGAAKPDTEGVLTTLTLKLSEALKYDNQLAFKEGSYIDSNEVNPTYYEVGADIPVSNVVISAFGGGDIPIVKNPTGTIALKKAITTGEVNDTPVEGESQYFIIPTVKKGNNEAAYGDDYIVKYGETELTKAQYSNLVNGHLNAENVVSLNVTSINDVVNNVIYVMYDKDVTVAAQLVNAESGEIQNAGDGEISQGPATPTTPPKAPSIAVSNKTVNVDTNFDVTVTVANAKAGAKITYTIVKDSKGTELGEGDTSRIQVYGSDDKSVEKTVGDETKVTQKFTASNSKGTAYIKVAYSDDENNTVAPKVITITISENSGNGGNGGGNGSGNDSTGSGSGPIAGPAGGNGNVSGVITFNDIANVEWAREAILMLANKGIISGRGDGIFDPNANITRAEYCQILVGAIGKTNEAADSSFDDVATDAWYYHAVSVASDYGIVSGYGDGNFGPNNLITRQDMALMTYKAAQVMNKNLSAARTMSFADAGQIADYAKTAVQTLADAAIINGVSDTEFAPVANATRAQAAKILYDTFVKAN